jgi:site-specific recombinase XerD
MSTDRLEHVTEPAQEFLNPRQAVDYDSHREGLLHWLKTVGKDPNREKGLAEKTAENYASRLDKFYRRVWERGDGYTTKITHDDAEEYVGQLIRDEITKPNGEPFSTSTKRKDVDALKKLFQWRAATFDEEPWETDVSFNQTTYNHADELSTEERNRLREIVLEYDSIPAYGDVTPEERDRWKAYLAQKLGKPKSEVSPDDWERVNQSWKIPSLVWATLDAGLRSIEVGRARTSWIRVEKATLYIPREESSKNRENWEVAIQDRTANALSRWLEQRTNDPRYDGRDEIWLNRQGNPYNSANLNYLLGNLCEAAGIDQENRKITWYSIRHSVGTYMTSKGNLAEAQEQLRHKSLETTLRYAHPPVEDRRKTLDKMG